MSSTISSTDTKSIPKPPHSKFMEDKTQRLVRTSSLDKIRRLNSYICSQHFYILPSLLAWLKSSQSGLQASTETTIFFFRWLLLDNFLYKVYQLEYKSLAINTVDLVAKQIRSTASNIESTFLLKIAVYFAGAVLTAELGLCFYLLSNSVLPSGLIFLIVCWVYINYLHLKTVCFYAYGGGKLDFIKKSK